MKKKSMEKIKKVEDSCVCFAISQLKLDKDLQEHIKGYLFYELRNIDEWELSNHWTCRSQDFVIKNTYTRLEPVRTR